MNVSRALLVLSSTLCPLLITRAAHAAQPLTGTVYDGATAEPVAGATVSIRGLAVKAITDVLGQFIFEGVGKGTWTLDVSKPPLLSTSDTVVVEADKPPPPLDLLLIGHMEAVELVQQAKVETPTAGGTQMLRKEIMRVPGARGDALAAVQSLPGIANTGTFTPFSSGLILRGSDPSDGRVLVDGFEIPLLYHFGAVQSILPSEMIEDIIYSPGGFGAEHGRASSGTIEVRTRKGTADYGGFAELSFINAAAFLQGPVGDKSNRATFAFSVRRSIVDAIVPAVLPEDSGTDFTVLPRYYDWQGRVDWQPADRWKLSMFVFGTDDATKFALDRNDPADPALTGEFGTSTVFGRAIASATYEGEKFKNRTALSLDFTRFKFEMSSDRHLRLSNEGITLRDEAEYKFGPKLTLRGGAEMMTQLVGIDQKMPRPEREGDPNIPNFTYDEIIERKEDVTLPTLGAWVTADVQLASNLQLTSGLRYDGFLRNGAHVIQPRAELKLDIGGNTIRAAGGLYTRPPYWEDEVLQSNLKPEKNWQASLGIEREIRPGLMAQATAFHSRRSDLITFSAERRTEASGADAYSNRGSGSTSGLELMLSSRGPKHFAWAAYTLSRSVRKDGPGGQQRLFDFDQTHNLILVGSRKFGKKDQWQLGGRFQLTTGKPYTPVVRADLVNGNSRYRPVFGEVNSDRVETMHQLDLRLDRIWDFKTWSLSAYLDIQNVYAHATVMDYRYNADYSEKKPIKTLPILPSIGIRASF